MAFRTILVPVDAAPGCDDRIRLAADLARSWDAALIGVGAQPFDADAGAGYGFIDAGILESAREQIERDLEGWQQRLRDLAGSVGAGLRWVQSIEPPANAVSAQAQGADLIVTSRTPHGPRYFQASPADLVMETGLPVLVAPPERRHLDTRRVLVAWTDGREARRAVGDALPLLIAAEQVLLLEVGAGRNGGSSSEQLGALHARLLRHGVKAEMRSEAREGRVSTALLAAAGWFGAGLLVAGAYGHSRLREWALGGVTRDLLESADLPVFLSR